MSRLKLSLIPMMCCALALALGAAPAKAEENRVVAVVCDDVITSLDLDKILTVLEAQVASAAAEHPGEKLPNKPQMRRMALERLIEDKIFDQEVKRANITVTPPEIDHYIERLKAANQLSDDEFAAQLSRRGLTPDEYKQDLKRELLKHKLVERNVKSRVVISDKEVDDYYRSQQTGQAPDAKSELRLRAVFLSIPAKATPAAEEEVRKQAEELRKKAASGDNFAELARRYSQGPGATQGGELGQISESDMLPEMRQALGQLKPGQVSQVIKVPGSYVFMQIMNPATQPSASGLRPEQREQIRVKLEHEALEKGFREWLTDLRSKAYVKIME